MGVDRWGKLGFDELACKGDGVGWLKMQAARKSGKNRGWDVSPGVDWVLCVIYV